MGQVGRRRFVVALGAATLARPLGTLAQRAPGVPRIGILALDRGDSRYMRSRRLWAIEDLRSAGFEVGRDVIVEWHYADGDRNRLRELATELVRMKVDAIVGWNAPPVHAAWEATREIPIIMFWYAFNPVDKGFAKSIQRPGGNVTGTLWAPDFAGIITKQYQLLKIALPNAKHIAALWRVDSPAHRQWEIDLKVRVTKETGLIGTDFLVDTEADIPQALARIAEFKPDAALISMQPVVRSRIDEVVAFTKQHKLVSMGIGTPWAEMGGLMTYTTDIRHGVKQTMSYAARVLRGARPGDLAMEYSTRFALEFNKRTAEEIGYTPTKELLARITHVYE